MDAEATFIAKETGIVAGISLAEMIFNQVDSSLQVRYTSPSICLLCFFLHNGCILTLLTILKVEWSQKDGDCISKGMQFGKVYGMLVTSLMVLDINLS